MKQRISQCVWNFQINNHFATSDNPGVCYFFRYNEKMQLSFFKRIDFTVSIKHKIGVYWACGVTIIPQIGKMFMMTWPNFFLVLDMRTFQVSQVLLYTLLISPGVFLKWSKQDRVINVLCSDYHSDQRLNLKYALYWGQAFKELALNAVFGNFSIEKIQASNLTHSLVWEIVTRKMYWFTKFKSCICL